MAKDWWLPRVTNGVPTFTSHGSTVVAYWSGNLATYPQSVTQQASQLLP